MCAELAIHPIRHQRISSTPSSASVNQSSGRGWSGHTANHTPTTNGENQPVADNTIKRSPMHDDLQAAGYQHQTTSPYNGLAKHTYSGHGGYSEVLNKHGYKQITNTVWKHEASDDSVQLRPADQGHKLVHTHHDKSYQYPNEDVEQKVGEMLEFEMEGNLTVESKQRMTQMFIEAAATYAAEAVADLVAMTNESVERMEQVVEWMEGQMQQQEQRQDYLGEALVGLVQDVYTDEGDANEF